MQTIKVQAAELKRALTLISRHKMSHYNVAAFDCVRVTVRPASLILERDMCNAVMSVDVSADADELEVFVVDYRELKSAVGTSKGLLALEIGDEKLTVRNSHAVTLQLRNELLEEHKGWDRFGDFQAETSISVPTTALHYAVDAANKDAARPILCSVLIEGQDMVATDSYRLHRVTLPEPGPDGAAHLIPAEMVRILRTARTKASDYRVRIGQAAGYVVAELEADEGCKIRARTVEGEFPNWRQLFPSTILPRFDADAETFRAAAKDAAAWSKTTGAPVKVRSCQDLAYLTGHAVEVSDFEAEVPVRAVEECEEIGLNPTYLAELVPPADRFTFSATDHLKPVLVESGPYRGLLMPVRI